MHIEHAVCLTGAHRNKSWHTPYIFVTFSSEYDFGVNQEKFATNAAYHVIFHETSEIKQAARAHWCNLTDQLDPNGAHYKIDKRQHLLSYSFCRQCLRDARITKRIDPTTLFYSAENTDDRKELPVRVN